VPSTAFTETCANTPIAMLCGVTCSPISEAITIVCGSTPPSANHPKAGRGKIRVTRCPLFREKVQHVNRAGNSVHARLPAALEKILRDCGLSKPHGGPLYSYRFTPDEIAALKPTLTQLIARIDPTCLDTPWCARPFARNRVRRFGSGLWRMRQSPLRWAGLAGARFAT
jgi:hypothetical protein